MRIVHLGLGSFFRSHQAWYTDRAPDRGNWGIAAFAGRSARIATLLTAQDCLYTLRTRGVESRDDVVASISEAHAAVASGAWLRYFRSPGLALVTLTVTEAGYLLRRGGGADLSNAELRRDMARLRSDRGAGMETVVGKLVAGLCARRSAGAGGIAIVPCDNIAANGEKLREAVEEVADAAAPGLAPWLADNVTWVSTVVDRITPASTAADVDEVERTTGRHDAVPVTTESFSEWILAGEFPAGRPQWEQAGAQFVDDVTEFERRKLWLLNGAHSLLAYAGGTRGHATVGQAVSDPVVWAWVEQWWGEASAHLRISDAAIRAYQDALKQRFANPHITHQLAQIAADGSQKLPLRVVPVLRAERRARRLPLGAMRVLAGWLCHLRGIGAPVDDAAAPELARVATEPLPEAARSAVWILDPDLATDQDLVAALAGLADQLTGPDTGGRAR